MHPLVFLAATLSFGNLSEIDELAATCEIVLGITARS